MVLVRKAQEFARNAHRLQDIEWCQTLCNRQPIIQFIVDDQVRGSPLLQMSSWIPFCVSFSVVPECATEVVAWEEELLGGELIQGAEDSVVSY